MKGEACETCEDDELQLSGRSNVFDEVIRSKCC